MLSVNFIIFVLFFLPLLNIRFIKKQSNISQNLDPNVKAKRDSKTEAVLNQFRKLVGDMLESDYEMTDEFLLRWLNECEMDAECASEKFHENKAWRQINNMDTILNETFSDIFMPACFVGQADNNGKSYLAYSLEAIDYRKLILSGKKTKLMRYHLSCMERMLVDSYTNAERGGNTFQKGPFIVNLAGFTMKAHGCYQCVAWSKELMEAMWRYYPRLGRPVILFNAPRIALPLIDLVKPSFGIFYGKNLKVFGTNKTEWSTFLLKNIESHRLPVEFGGTQSMKTI